MRLTWLDPLEIPTASTALETPEVSLLRLSFQEKPSKTVPLRQAQPLRLALLVQPVHLISRSLRSGCGGIRALRV